jgi:hypothetical protein
MKNDGKWGWSSCLCDPGYQQGPDGNGSFNGICIPCGQKTFASQCSSIAGQDLCFNVGLCPATYPNWISKVESIVDKMDLPNMAYMKSKVDDINLFLAEKSANITAGLANMTSTAIDTIKNFHQTSLLELDRIHGAALIQSESKAYQHLEAKWVNISKVYGFLVGKLSAAATAARRTALVALQTASAWYNATVVKAKQLADAAAQAVAALPKMLKDLGELIITKAKELISYAKEQVGAAIQWVKEQWKRLKKASGSLSISNPNFKLCICNPTSLNMAIHKATVDVDYAPETTGLGNWGSESTINLTRVSIGKLVEVKGYGCTNIDILELLSSISIDLGDIFVKHGIFGFLEDIALRGKLNLALKVSDLDFRTYGLGAVTSSVVNFVFNVFDRITIPIKLPENITAKARDAVGALNYLDSFFSNDSKLGKMMNASAEEQCNAKKAEVTQAGDDKGQDLERDVEEKEEEALLAVQNETNASKAFSLAMIEAAKEVQEEEDAAKSAATQIKESASSDESAVKSAYEKALDVGQEALSQFEGIIKQFSRWFGLGEVQ